jgi:redox-sensitive bicupin YhaK (pirin superfamily)
MSAALLGGQRCCFTPSYGVDHEQSGGEECGTCFGHGPGLTTYDATEAELGADMDPFIVVSLYDMAGPTFPPHPHAGFAVATYMLPESPVGFINQDSLGHRNEIPPGALHVTVAGSGVLHEEQPAARGRVARGFQIWIDFLNGSRSVAPTALHLPAADVPTVNRDGAKIRAVLGESNGVRSPLSLPTAVRIIDVALEADASFTQMLGSDENAFVLVIDGGVVMVDDASPVQRATASQLIRSEPGGETLTLRAGTDANGLARGARFTLFAGMPFKQPRAQRGPMVASDVMELQRFMSAYSAGSFRRLTPFAAQAST